MMTDEELSKIRSNWNTIAGRTFGIIDNFAINRECAESLQAVPKLLAHIGDQAGQIATLKAALISERNRYLVDFIHEYDDVRDCKEEAKSQLAKEYPEIFAEEKE